MGAPVAGLKNCGTLDASQKVTKIESRFFGIAKKSKVAHKDPDTRLRKWVNKGAFYLTVFPLTRQSFACNRLDHPQNAEVNGNI